MKTGMRVVAFALLISIAAALSAQTQPAPASSKAAVPPPVFDVAAIHPVDMAARAATCYMRGQPGGQTFTGRCIPLRLMIKYAYKIVDSQIAGGPSWIDSDLFDFEAKSDRSVTRDEVAAMFQAFIADRFHLQFHRETRTLPSFVLTVDKSGSKMTANTSTYEWEIPVQNIPGKIPTVKGVRCPMYYLSWWIGQREDRAVIDKTGLTGFWDFTLAYLPGEMAAHSDAEGQPLEKAIREQLGLKLESGKGPVEVYVIDHVEKPEN
jgi:uncharacterized protein (TIGR03435 family)